MLTFEHADKLLNNEIVFIINEFDIYLQKDQKIIDILESELMFYKNDRDSKLMNLTDGLREATSFKNRIHKIYDRYQTLYQNYFRILEKAKVHINFSKSILLVESILSAISNKQIIVCSFEENKVTSLNNFQDNYSGIQQRIFLEGFLRDKTVIIVDCAISNVMIDSLKDCTEKVLFIGSKFYHTYNQSLLRKDLDTIDIAVDDYFTGIVTFIEGRVTHKKLCNIVENFDLGQRGVELHSLLSTGEIDNYLSLINLFQFNAEQFSMLLSYICKYEIRKSLSISRFFLNSPKILGYDDHLLLIKETEQVLSKNDTNCLIVLELWKFLDLTCVDRIRDFMDYIKNNRGFLFYSATEKKHAINEILSSYSDELRHIVFAYILEYICQTEDFFIITEINGETIPYINSVNDFIQCILSGSVPSKTDLPAVISDVLGQFKSHFENNINWEWIHSDGINYNFSTVAPFPEGFKCQVVHSENVVESNYIAARPIISNDYAFQIEESRAKIINLNTLKWRYHNFKEAITPISFCSYNSNLIYTTKTETYLMTKEGKNNDLSVKLLPEVYNSLRIRNNKVYYFTDSETLRESPLNGFLDSLGLFDGEDYRIPKTNNVNDLLVLEKEAFCITQLTSWKLNFETRQYVIFNHLINPLKLFYCNNKVYILTDTEVWRIEGECLKWVTDVGKWSLFTCVHNLLILARGDLLEVINLSNGNMQIIYNELLKNGISDIIATREHLLVVDDLGNLYRCDLDFINTNKNLDLKIFNILSVQGTNGLLSFYRRYLSVYNKTGFYIYTA